MLNGSKPILQEVGPFVYKSETVKESIKWHDDNTMSYRPRSVCELCGQGLKIEMENFPILGFLFRLIMIFQIFSFLIYSTVKFEILE